MLVSKSFKRVVFLQLAITVGLLAIGLYRGLLQTIYRTGILQDTAFINPGSAQGVTGYGIINILVLTAFFAVAFGHVIIAFYFKQEPDKKAMRSGMILMCAGLIVLLLTGNATTPNLLQQHPLWYTGAILFIIGSWIPLFSWSRLYRQWKKLNPVTNMPLAVLGIFIHGIIWVGATLPVAGSMLMVLLPQSMGWFPFTNTAFIQTISGHFSHAVVYGWLVLVYILCYTVLPAVAGGRFFSDILGRMLLFSLLIFAVPILPAYQNKGGNFLSGALGYGLIITGIITVFIIAASLEYAGKKNGGIKGLFSWVERLPYFDETKYLFAYLLCGITLLALGCITTLVNTAPNTNNTWLAGNFHLTIAGPVFLSIAGMSLYLYTNISGKKITWPKLNVTIPYLWVMGMLLFSLGLNWGGMLGEPPTVYSSLAHLNPDSELFRPDWAQTTILTLLGGLILFVAGLLFIIIFFGTLFSAKTENDLLQLPVSSSFQHEKPIPFFNRFTPWLIITATLIMMSYLPTLVDVISNDNQAIKPAVVHTPVIQPMTKHSREQPLSIQKDYGLLLGFLASVGIFILILLFCVQASGLQRKLRSQKSSFPG
jgi:cytochrome c oxidase subunit 1